jgi:hypothetical protein
VAPKWSATCANPQYHLLDGRDISRFFSLKILNIKCATLHHPITQSPQNVGTSWPHDLDLKTNNLD